MDDIEKKIEASRARRMKIHKGFINAGYVSGSAAVLSGIGYTLVKDKDSQLGRALGWGMLIGGVVFLTSTIGFTTTRVSY